MMALPEEQPGHVLRFLWHPKHHPDKPEVKENLDLVRSVFAEWERGEVSTRPEWADPGMEFEIPDSPRAKHPNGDWGKSRRRSFLELWEHFRFEAKEYRDLDDGSVLVESRMTGRGKASGVHVNQPGASLFRVSNGKVTRRVLYWDRDRALSDLELAS
jgi:ketosteroid isomerase-like protein